MTTQLAEKNQELAEKLSGLKQVKSPQELLQGLKSQERVDKLLLVLLDCSGSMGDRLKDSSNQIQPFQTTSNQSSPSHAKPYQTKLQIAWKVLQQQLTPNLLGWTYGVVAFGEDIRWEVTPTTNTQALITRDTPVPRGFTPMGKALQFAWSWVRTNVKQARFIMLTDGQANDMPKEQILEKARDNAGIPIDCVGIGHGTFDYDKEFLEKLSSITGGVFYEVDTVKLLADTIKRLSPNERPLLGIVREE